MLAPILLLRQVPPGMRACAFLCGAQAGFTSGQALQLDGGSYARSI